MAVNKLSTIKVESILAKAKKAAAATLAKSALISDGGGLYISQTKSGTCSWLFRVMVSGESYTFGLGGIPKVSLKIAREKAQQIRDNLANGIDPSQVKKNIERQQDVARSKSKTFSTCAAEYIEMQAPSWTNSKHKKQWTSSLANHVMPILGGIPISRIDTNDVLRVLAPIWVELPETASRIRSRIEKILGWSHIHGWREKSNPAMFRDHLEHLLPKKLVTAKKHHAAMHYSKVPEFFSKLQLENGVSPLALSFLILTAGRTAEVTGAKWSEFDFEKKIWTVPAERMKTKRTHMVPLSPKALQILATVKPFSEGEYVFQGMNVKKPISNMSMTMTLRRMKIKDATCHGFRSSFRDYVGVCLEHPFHVAEQALAHSLPDKIQLAYLRSDFFVHRVKMMDSWENFVTSKTENSA